MPVIYTIEQKQKRHTLNKHVMKTRSIILSGLVVMLSAAFTNAQSLEPAVKILPAAEKGMLKILYAASTEKAVDVKFISENGLIKSDRIKAGSFQKGFTKKYDVSGIKANAFWVEVSSNEMTVRYKLIESKDRQSFVPYLEKTTYNHPLVAAIN